jgi:hypothetical protein
MYCKGDSTLLAVAVLVTISASLGTSNSTSAYDCGPRLQQEMDAINRRAAAQAPTCQDMLAQIRSYEFIVKLFQDPGCNASNPSHGIAQMRAKLAPLRSVYAKACKH